MKYSFVVVTTLALAACTSAPATPAMDLVQTAVAQTIAAQFAPTDTPVPTDAPTETPRPTNTRVPTWTNVPSLAKSEPTLDLVLGGIRRYKDLGEVTSNDVKVSLDLVYCLDKPSASLLEVKWPEIDELADATFICAFYVSIYNGSSEPIAYSTGDVYFVMGDTQVSLADCNECYTGISPYEDIQPGVNGEVTFITPFSKLPEELPIRILLVMGRLFNENISEYATERIAIEKIIEGR